jgi:hypothetical protein
VKERKVKERVKEENERKIGKRRRKEGGEIIESFF